MAKGFCAIDAELSAAVLGPAGARTAGRVGYGCINGNPRAFSCIRDATREPHTRSASAGMARIFRGALASTNALLADLVPSKPIDLIPDLQGRRRRLWNAPNIIFHAQRTTSSRVADFMFHRGATTCLRISFA